MSESLSAIPSGVRYYFGSEAHLRRAIEHAAMTIFKAWSYEEITPPTVDYYSLFERGMGSVEAQDAFRFTDTDGKLLALRPDVTSGIARAAATLMAKRERPLRFSYAAPVFRLRAESHAEWRRESTQIGCELIGRNGCAADMEVLAIAVEILSFLGLDGSYTITINDLEIFNGIVGSLGLDATAQEELRELVDTRNARDLELFLASYTSAEECASFAQLVQLSGRSEVFENARRVITNERSAAALGRLETLWTVVDSVGLSAQFEVDLGDVSRLDYYTGLLFKIYVAGVGTRVGSGGRYDQLTANFGKAEPAVGFVLDLDALAEAMRANESITRLGEVTERTAARIMDEDPKVLFREALRKRERGDKVLISPKREVMP